MLSPLAIHFFRFCSPVFFSNLGYVEFFGTPGKTIKSANEDTVGGVFFLARNMHPGSKMTLHLTRTTSSVTLLPRRVSDSIPFNSTQLPTILSRLSVEPNSAKAEAIKKTLSECEEPAFAGETKLCASSLESMVEFAMSSLKTHSIQAMSTKVSKEGTPKQEYTIVSLRKMPASELVACHGASYAYAVFHCHTTSASAYTASMVGMDGSKVEALAACQTDKAAGVEEAFKKFGVEPGTVPVCHFLPQVDLLWARN
ncbi:BURP domain-containing protein 6-like isoform X1 [Typha latifolia]|uniref:BURP domain-containing protein 6-like isoform X1 n=1 Tax=Typha latifolia TaxID=4733 RepID=UPI003C2BAF95